MSRILLIVLTSSNLRDSCQSEEPETWKTESTMRISSSITVANRTNTSLTRPISLPKVRAQHLAWRLTSSSKIFSKIKWTTKISFSPRFRSRKTCRARDLQNSNSKIGSSKTMSKTGSMRLRSMRVVCCRPPNRWLPLSCNNRRLVLLINWHS